MLKLHFIDQDTKDVRQVLGLSLEEAFENVWHLHILKSISRLNLGAEFHKFASSSLGSEVPQSAQGTSSMSPTTWVPPTHRKVQSPPAAV
ncbi:hypothetical protein HPB50_006916 [Hyalomma asiaticum]|uniref:Uncharacterized protein n=1 Tax=Hyalomma asiaticum TaxID=266040 RepID=A0ACB7S1V4_HYAAI|nr:hypothetical protein HPB50_006916 [Hyalomma asiaticum]